MAAEIAAGRRGGRRPHAGFNEAAANGRGNLVQLEVWQGQATMASMRPRRMAAEISNWSEMTR